MPRFNEHLLGWVCVLGWNVGVAGLSYLVAIQIQGLLILNDGNYFSERWHATLLMIAISVVSIIFNAFFAMRLPLVETIILLLHVFGFFAVLITLWVFAPGTPASAVFTEFSDNGNWGSVGLSCLVGMTGAVYNLIGPDSAVHMCLSLHPKQNREPLLK